MNAYMFVFANKTIERKPVSPPFDFILKNLSKNVMSKLYE